MKKNILKNYLYNLSYQILMIVVPLITTPYLSRVLGADSLGIYSYTLSIATYFILFGSLGVAMYGQREIAYYQNEKYERSKIFYEILLMRFITLGISLIIFYFSFCLKGEYNTYYKILVLEIIATSLDISWFFQGLEEFKKTVVRNTIVKIISVMTIFLLVKSKDDLIIYFVIYVLSNLLGNLSLWLYLPRFTDKVHFKDLKIFKHLKPTIALFIPQIAIQVYTVLDKTMIGKILGDMSEVGNYEQSQKIIKLSLTLVTALGTVVFPRIANTMANNKKDEVEHYLANSFRFVWFIGIPIMFGIMAIAKNLVPWFLGEEFNKSVSILMLGAPLIMAIGLNNVSGVQYLIATKKQNLFTKSVIFGAIFNFTVNFILINRFKATGAIVASVLAETIIFIVQIIDIRKDISLKIVYKNNIKYLISGAIMFLVTFGIGFLLKPNIVSTLIQIIIGMVTYSIILIILKDKMLYETLSKLKNKVKENK